MAPPLSPSFLLTTPNNHGESSAAIYLIHRQQIVTKDALQSDFVVANTPMSKLFTSIDKKFRTVKGRKHVTQRMFFDRGYV